MWGGFADWNAAAIDSFFNGLTWTLGFGLLVLFLSWGWGMMADLFKRII